MIQDRAANTIMAVIVALLVASNSRDPRFKTSHQLIIFTKCTRKTKIKKKMPRMARFLNKKQQLITLQSIYSSTSQHPLLGFGYKQVILLVINDFSRKLNVNINFVVVLKVGSELLLTVYFGDQPTPCFTGIHIRQRPFLKLLFLHLIDCFKITFSIK